MQLSHTQIKHAQSMLQAKRRNPKPPVESNHAVASGRLKIMVWNSGGLAYQDFLHRVTSRNCPPDFVVVLETRLPHDMEHTTTNYCFMYSAKPHADIMLLISKSLAPARRITWRAVEIGRLVHARVYGTRSHISVIGFYQQAWQPQHADNCLKTRQHLQGNLEKLLEEGSDNQLNTDLKPMDRLVGNAEPAHAQATPRQLDWEQLHSLTRRQDFCALSAFQKLIPTYQGKGARSPHHEADPTSGSR